ncbi:MAG: LysE family transporter [Pseudomonadota bacterium]
MNLALWTSLLTIAGVWFVTVLLPGPNFFATAITATRHSRREGLMVAGGIAIGTTVWATASLLGLGLLFQTAGWLYQLVNIVGGLYLIYFGVRTILSAGAAPSIATNTIGAPGPTLSSGCAIRRGVIVDLSNPKAAVFFASLFAVAVPPEAALWFKALVVSITVVMAGGWYAIVACFVTIPPMAALMRRAERTIAAITGAIFVILGLRIATDR